MIENNYPGLGLFAALNAHYDGNFFSLPEEIRDGVEQRKEEIHTKEDLQRVVHELNLKK